MTQGQLILISLPLFNLNISTQKVLTSAAAIQSIKYDTGNGPSRNKCCIKGKYSNDKINMRVIPTINGTRLFLYLSVLKIEY